MNIANEHLDPMTFIRELNTSAYSLEIYGLKAFESHRITTRD